MRRRQAITLTELLVSIAVASLLLVVLGLLARVGKLNFETGTSQVVLTQTARLVLEKVTPYVCSAVPPGVVQGRYIYSPTQNKCSEDPSLYPNIYCLDFVSCIDFSNPSYAAAPETIPGYNNRRGTGPRSRYRVRYDLPTGRLLLEKLDPASPVDAPTLAAGAQPQILGRDLARVTFEKKDLGINLRISSRTTDKNGKLVEGLGSAGGHTLDPDDPSAPSHRKARTYELFTTVFIPFQTCR